MATGEQVPEADPFVLRGRFLGLNARDHASVLPLGAFSECDNAMLYPSQALMKCSGYEPITRQTPSGPGVLLDGFSHQYRVRRGVNITGTAWTIETLVRSRSLYCSRISVAAGVASCPDTRGATVLCRAGNNGETWSWNSSTGYEPNYILYLYSDEPGGSATASGQPTFAFGFYSGGTFYQVYVPISTGFVFNRNRWYHVAVRYDRTKVAPDAWIEIIVRDAVTGTKYTGTITTATQAPPAGDVPDPSPNGADLLIGSRWEYGTGADGEAPNCLFDTPTAMFRDWWHGNVEEVRFWDTYRSDSQLDSNWNVTVSATASLVACYQLRGAGSTVAGKKFVTISGTTEPAYLEPVDAVWDSAYLTEKGYALYFNGEGRGLRIRDAYLYRLPEQSDRSIYEMRPDWSFSMSFHMNADAYRTQVLADFSDCGRAGFDNVDYDAAPPSYSYIVANSADRGVWRVQLLAAPAPVLSFHHIVYDTTGGGRVRKEQVLCHSTTFPPVNPATVAINTTYSVAWGVRNGNTMWMVVNGAFYIERRLDDDGLGGFFASWETPYTDEFGAREAKKYAFTVGCGINRLRFGTVALGDPNDIDIEMDRSTCLLGRIDNLCAFGTSIQTTTIPKFLRTNKLDSAATKGFADVILSSWPVIEGGASNVEDVGLVGNSIVFTEDPDHLQSIAYISQSKGRCFGVIDHRWRPPTGTEERRRLLVHDGGVSLINSDKTITTFAEGLRNDTGKPVMTARWRDSTIIATGNRPMMLFRDELVPATIDAPSGQLTWGIVDQMRGTTTGFTYNSGKKRRKGKLRAGLRKFAFTFFDERTGRRSPVEMVAFIDLLWESQNIIFGMAPEVAQEPAEFRTFHDIEDPGPAAVDASVILTGDDNDTAGVDGKEPFNFTTGWETADANKHGLKIKAWFQVSGSLEVENEAKYKKFRFSQNNPLATNIDGTDVPAWFLIETINSQSDDRSKRILAEELDDGTVRFRTKFVGSNAAIRAKVLDNNGTMRRLAITSYSTATDTGVISGSGSTEARPLPRSPRPDVTHLEIWATVADGNTFYLADRIPNGQDRYKYATPDKELVGGEILDIDAINPPSTCSGVREFDGHYIWFLDRLTPSRIYISRPDEPWAIRTGGVIDLLDGNATEVLGCEKTQGALAFFKRDVVFLATATGDEELPFAIRTRVRDIGGVSPYGATNVRGRIVYASDQGVMSFDGTSVDYLSQVIEPIWQSYLPERLKTSFSVHHRNATSAIFWVPSGAYSDQTAEGFSSQYLNDTAIVWNYEIGAGADGLMYGYTRLTGVPQKIGYLMPDENERFQVVLLDPLGYVHKMTGGNNYGLGSLNGGVSSLSVSGGGAATVTVPTANADLKEGYRGLPVTLVRAADSSRETRYAIADSGGSPSTVTVDRAWSGAAPVSGDTLLLGSIEFSATTGQYAILGQDRVSVVERSFLELVPQVSSGWLQVSFLGTGGVRNSQPWLNADPISTAKREERFAPSRAQAVRGRFISTRFLLPGPGLPVGIVGMALMVRDGGSGFWGGTP